MKCEGGVTDSGRTAESKRGEGATVQRSGFQGKQVLITDQE